MSGNLAFLRSLLLMLCLAEAPRALEITPPVIQSQLGQGLKLRARLVGGPELDQPLSSTIECLSPECRELRLRSRVSGRQSGDLAIEVISLDAVNIPALSLRLGIHAGSIQQQRDFTVLLDPPAYQLRQVLLAAAPAAPPRERKPDPAPRRQQAVTPSVAAPASPSSKPVVAAAGSEWRVRRGETLTRIARHLAHQHGGRAHEWADRLWQMNPQAFVRHDPDRLKAGAVLLIPGTPAAPVATEAKAPPVPAMNLMDTAEVKAEQTLLKERLARMEERLLALESALAARPAPVEAMIEPVAATTSLVAAQILAPSPPVSAVPTTTPAPDAPAAALEVVTSVPGMLDSAWTLIVGAGLISAALLLLGLKTWRRRDGGDRKGMKPVHDEALKAAIRERLYDETAALPTPADGHLITLDLSRLRQPAAKRSDQDVAALSNEVDVHIVYGAFAEAEAVLLDALKASGDSAKLLVKLAEVYYYQRGIDKLVALGEKVQAMDLPAWVWAKVFRLGHDLCPEQPIFHDAALAGRSEHKAAGRA